MKLIAGFPMSVALILWAALPVAAEERSAVDGSVGDDCLAGGAYFVSQEPGCDDGGPGTESDPWCSIQKSADSMVAGDTVCIKQGLYLEMIQPERPGTPGQPITYRSYPGHEELVTVSGEYQRAAAFVIAGVHHIRVSGLRLTAGWSAGLLVVGPASDLVFEGIRSFGNGAGVQWEGHGIALRAGGGTAVQRVSITGCEISDNELNGIAVWGGVSDLLIRYNTIRGSTDNIRISRWGSIAVDGHSERITIADNEIHHALRQGIVLRSTHSLWITGNHLHHNGATGIQLHWDEAGYSNVGAVIEGNLSEHNSQVFPGETGIWIDGSDDVILRHNTLRHNELGLEISKSNRLIARNNLIYGNSGNDVNRLGAHGISIRSEISSGELPTTDIVVVHNTLYRNGHADSQVGEVMMLGDELDGVLFENNIISETATPYELVVLTATDPEKIDHNDYHQPSRPTAFVWQGQLYGWADYRATAQRDQSSLEVQPGFVDPWVYDLRLRAYSPLIDAGAHLTTTRSAGAGNVIEVDDARYFSDGLGMALGDLVRVGASEPVAIVAVDHASNTIEVDQALTWTTSVGVTYAYHGLAPDIGALEDDGLTAPIFADSFESGSLEAWISAPRRGPSGSGGAGRRSFGS